MSQLNISELANYVRRVGEHINIIYSKIDEIDKKVEAMDKKMMDIGADLENNKNEISKVKETAVQMSEFDDFVNRLTESLRELLPPISVETEQVLEDD